MYKYWIKKLPIKVRNIITYIIMIYIREKNYVVRIIYPKMMKLCVYMYIYTNSFMTKLSNARYLSVIFK